MCKFMTNRRCYIGYVRYTRQNLAVLRNFIVERCNTLALEIARDDNGDAVYNGDLIAAAKQAVFIDKSLCMCKFMTNRRCYIGYVHHRVNIRFQ